MTQNKLLTLVLKMVIKARAPMLKHTARTHRMDLDWLFERISTDPAVFDRYIHTKLQIADMLTRGNFGGEQWLVLCCLLHVGPAPKGIYDTGGDDKRKV